MIGLDKLYAPTSVKIHLFAESGGSWEELWIHGLVAFLCAISAFFAPLR